jgi:hypothetical protein
MAFNAQFAQPAQPALYSQYPVASQFIPGGPQSVPRHPPQIYSYGPPPQALNSGPYLIHSHQATNLQRLPLVSSDTSVPPGESGTNALNMLTSNFRQAQRSDSREENNSRTLSNSQMRMSSRRRRNLGSQRGRRNPRSRNRRVVWQCC